MATGLIWDLLAKDQASPTFLRVAGAADKAAASTARAQKGVANWTAASARAGAKLTKSLTLPLVAVAGLSIKSAMSFQQATNVYVTAAGESAKNLGIVRDGIKKVAVETGTSIKNLTDAEYIAEKAHLRGAAGIAVLAAAAKGAREENANLSDVMQAMTSIMASYHLPATRAVSVMNALKTGAGSAKVTMEAYSQSLSTVIPVASAAGIGLDQLLGAESTLTQHGTTADEATQELANTIRNLQAPNNVAISAMNQLGIASVNVSKNLGKRGLTGTLEYIESKLPKSGLVYLTTMKRMEAGTADLTAMQSKMSPTLAKLSKQYLDGSIGLSDYRKTYRGMGAESAAQGTAFEALSKKVLGYNDNIKNGTPAQKTMAAELKAIFGGATGLNTVLQLGAGNLAGFKGRVDAVGASLHDSTGEVEGWTSTQKLAAVQADIAKQKLHVLGIEIGAALLPVFNHLVGGVSKAVGWFENLSGTDKKIIGWSAVVVGALGPILSIGSRIGLAAGSLARFSGASVTTASTVARSTQKITTAIAGIGIAYAGIQKGGTTGGIMAALGGGLTGASIGSFFGPLGTAIGGVTGAVAGLGTEVLNGTGLWHDHSKAAQAALAAEKAYVGQLTAAIDTDNGALGANLKLAVTKQLQNKGILDEAQKLGINLATVVNAAIGKGGAGPALSKMLLSKEKSNLGQGLSILKGAGAAAPQTALATLASGNLDLSQIRNANGDVIKLTASQKAHLVTVAKVAAEYYTLIGALKGQNIDVLHAKKTADQYAHALNDDRIQSGAFTAQLEAFRKHTTIAEDATGQLTESLSKSTVVGEHNRTTLASLADAAEVDAERTLASALAHGKSLPAALKTADGALAANVKSIEKTATAAGFNKGQVAAMIAKYAHIPKSLVTKLTKKGVTPAELQAIIDKYNHIPRSVTTQLRTVVSTTTKGNLASTYHSQVPGRASGGGLPEGVSSVGERGAELAIKRGNHVDILSHPQAKAYLAATGMKAPGFAGGTITHSGKDYIYGGTRYASLRAAENAQNRASTAASKAQLAGAQGVVHDVALLNSAFRETSSQIRTTTNALQASAKAAGASSRVLSAMGVDASRLATMANRGAGIAARLGSPAAGSTAYDRLATAQGNYSGERSNVAGGIVGQMDLTQAGPLGIAATVAGQVNSTRAFLAHLKTLKARGLDATDLDQLAQKGPAGAGAAVSQLLGMSAGQLATIGRERAQLNTLGGQVGTLAAQGVYGAARATAEKQVDALLKQQKENTKEMQALTAELKKQASRIPVVHVYIDGKHLTAGQARALARQR